MLRNERTKGQKPPEALKISYTRQDLSGPTCTRIQRSRILATTTFVPESLSFGLKSCMPYWTVCLWKKKINEKIPRDNSRRRSNWMMVEKWEIMKSFPSFIVATGAKLGWLSILVQTIRHQMVFKFEWSMLNCIPGGKPCSLGKGTKKKNRKKSGLLPNLWPLVWQKTRQKKCYVFYLIFQLRSSGQSANRRVYENKKHRYNFSRSSEKISVNSHEISREREFPLRSAWHLDWHSFDSFTT